MLPEIKNSAGWPLGRISDFVARLESGVSVNGTDAPRAKDEPAVLKISSVTYGIFNPSACKPIISRDLKRAKCLPKKGDILISRSNTPGLVGASAYVPEDCKNLYLPDKLWRVVFRENNYAFPLWFFYWLSSPRIRSKISSLATGTSGSMYNITKEEFLSLTLFIPSLPEQKLIAKTLIAWDETIRKLQAAVETQREHKRALMQRLLTGKLRFPEFAGQPWQEVTLDDVFKRITRRNAEVHANVVTISAQRGFVKQGEYFNKSVASETLDNYFLLHKGEFAYNKSYSNGYPMGAIKRLNNFDKGVVTTLYICFTLKDETKSYAEFFEQFFEWGALNAGLTKVANEGGRAHGLLNVTPSDFFSLKLTIPGVDEQRKIAAVLSAADREIDQLTQKLDAYKQQKKGLMQQLLTGKKRVKLAHKEAA